MYVTVYPSYNMESSQQLLIKYPNVDNELNLLRINKLNYDICIAATPTIAVHSGSMLRLTDVGLVPAAGLIGNAFQRLPKLKCIYASTDLEI